MTPPKRSHDTNDDPSRKSVLEAVERAHCNEVLRREPLMDDIERAGQEIEAITDHSRNLARERSEQAEREATVVEELRAIRSELEHERTARERLEEQVREHEAELSRCRTGAPGRPGSSHFISDEFDRRVTLGELEPTLGEQARVLVDWLLITHPDAAPITAKTAENKIRAAYRRASAR